MFVVQYVDKGSNPVLVDGYTVLFKAIFTAKIITINTEVTVSPVTTTPKRCLDYLVKF